MNLLRRNMSEVTRRRWFAVSAKIIAFLVFVASLRLPAEQSKAVAEKPATPSGAATEGRTGSPKAATEKTGDWSEADELPLLARTAIRPIKNAADFSILLGDILQYPREPRPLRAKEEPFEKDADAIAAARAWITAHFGQLPQTISLEVTRIDRSPLGRPKPTFGLYEGHIIVFRERYHGLPTDSGPVIYIAGRTQFAATVELHT